MKKRIEYTCEICGKTFTGEDEFSVEMECERHEESHERPYDYFDNDLRAVFGLERDSYPDGHYERMICGNVPVYMKYGKGSNRPTVIYLAYQREDGTLIKIPYRNSNPNVIAEGKVKEEEEEDK